MAKKIKQTYVVVDKGSKTMKEATGKINKSLGSVEKRSKGVGLSLSSLAKGGAIAGAAIAGALVVKGLKKSIQAYSEFEQAMANVSTMVDNTEVSMEELGKGIRALPSNLGPATDNAKALYQALSAGVEPAKAIKLVAEAAQAAKAGLTDTFTAVDAGTTVINAFGMKAEDAGKVYDQMFTAVKAGKTTFEELSSTIGRLAPTMSAAGVPTEEMFSAVASLTSQGIQTSEAVTGLKAAMSNIIKPGKDASDMAEELGLSFNAQALKAKGLSGFLEDVAEATGGDVEKMSKLFGSVEALNSVLALTSEGGAKKFKDTMGDMEDSTGASEEAFGKQTKTMMEMWKSMKVMFEKIAITVGEKLAPHLKDAIEAISGWMEENKELIDMALDQLFNSLAIAFKAIGISINIVSPFFKAWLGVLKDVVKWIKIILEHPIAKKTLEWIMKGGTIVSKFVTRFFGEGSSQKPLGEKIIEMSGKLAGFLGMADKGASVNLKMESNGESLSDVMSNVKSSFSDMIDGMIDGTKTFEDVFSDMLKSIADGLMEMAKNQMISGIFQTIMGGAIGGLGNTSTIRGGMGGGYGFANGGIAPGGFQAFAAGGIANKPTLGLIGEGGMNEAVVPLPDGKSIPIEGGGGDTYTINIQAIDSKSLVDTLRRNPESIIIPITEQINRGNSGLRNSLKRAVS